MKNKEFVVGLFIIAGFLAFAYASLQFGEFSPFAMTRYYSIMAEFDNVSGLKEGATVELAGVQIGKVSRIVLNEDDRAMVEMQVERQVRITDDALAAIRTQGIIGDKYVKIIQGGSDEILQEGDIISDTESAIDLEEMISQYMFGKV